MSKADEFYAEQEPLIDASMDAARDVVKTLVSESRKFLPAVNTMSNGYANETPVTKPFNDALHDLWDILDHYGDFQYESLTRQMTVLRLTDQLDREKEKTHEERERADEAEELVKEMQRTVDSYKAKLEAVAGLASNPSNTGVSATMNLARIRVLLRKEQP